LGSRKVLNRFANNGRGLRLAESPNAILRKNNRIFVIIAIMGCWTVGRKFAMPSQFCGMPFSNQHPGPQGNDWRAEPLRAAAITNPVFGVADRKTLPRDALAACPQ
jgi:hypothetical protein